MNGWQVLALVQVGHSSGLELRLDFAVEGDGAERAGGRAGVKQESYRRLGEGGRG